MKKVTDWVPEIGFLENWNQPKNGFFPTANNWSILSFCSYLQVRKQTRNISGASDNVNPLIFTFLILFHYEETMLRFCSQDVFKFFLLYFWIIKLKAAVDFFLTNCSSSRRRLLISIMFSPSQLSPWSRNTRSCFNHV